jgi:hypothetical protein
LKGGFGDEETDEKERERKTFGFSESGDVERVRSEETE